MKKKLLVLGILLISLFLLNGASAQLGGNLTVNDSESATIEVNISSKVMVDITPATFAWDAVDPGTTCGYDVSDGTCNESLNNYRALQVENIGSVNITKVWFNASYPSQSPFGVGSAANTDAGNYVVLTKNWTSNAFWFINRVEYNATNTLYYLRDPDGNMPPNNSKFTYGRFHNGSNEYFWMLDNTSGCNVTGTNLYIGNSSHDKQNSGTTDFQNGDREQFSITNYDEWGYADIDTGPLSGLCVAVDANCEKLFFSKWNADKPFDACTNVNAALDTAGGDEPLVPGDSFAMKIGVVVPYGIYEGPSNSGQITALVI